MKLGKKMGRGSLRVGLGSDRDSTLHEKTPVPFASPMKPHTRSWGDERMMRIVEIEIPRDVAAWWPEFLSHAGINVKQGPTLQQMHEMAKRRLPNLGVPPPIEEENKWYRYIECFRGRTRVKISAELLQPGGRYVITVYTTARWLFKSRALKRLEEEIVSILCSKGGRLAKSD